jgi:hypothetical protein
MTPDLINGALEFLGGCFVLISVHKLWKDKRVAGISWMHVAFFSLWGVWNLYYYPSLDQWFSFAGGLFIVLVNTIYVGLLLFYGGERSRVQISGSAPERTRRAGGGGSVF